MLLFINKTYPKFTILHPLLQILSCLGCSTDVDCYSSRYYSPAGHEGERFCVNGEHKNWLDDQLNQELQEVFVNGENFTCKVVVVTNHHYLPTFY